MAVFERLARQREAGRQEGLCAGRVAVNPLLGFAHARARLSQPVNVGPCVPGPFCTVSAQLRSPAAQRALDAGDDVDQNTNGVVESGLPVHGHQVLYRILRVRQVWHLTTRVYSL